MGVISWLRRIVADFFRVSGDEFDAGDEAARRQLEQLRDLAILSVAQARRTELELREVMAAEEPDEGRLRWLVPRLEEERARAGELLARYRRHQNDESRRLARRGELQVTEEINERREELRRFIGRAGEASDTEELQRLEDEARAEAHRLDVLNQLDEDGAIARQPGAGALSRRETDLAARARALLEKPTVDPSVADQ